MKAVVWHDVGKISLDEVPAPAVREPSDAIVRLTTSAICGTDLHFVRGTMPGMRPGTILGHEAVGVVEETGPQVRNFSPGDRVVLPSTIGCGSCAYCRAGNYAQCDSANPNGRDAGTSFYGGPESTGPFDGLQAKYARVPYAHTNLVAIPPGVSDEQAIQDLTGGIGADRVIDAVGIDAQRPTSGPAAAESGELAGQFRAEQQTTAGHTQQDGQWLSGDAPSQALRWAVQAVAKAGTLGVIGVYPPQDESFPIGTAMNRNLTIKLGNCNHRRYVPGLLSKIATGAADPTTVITQQEELPSVLDAYEAFDRREPGWTKVTLELSG